MCVKRAITSVYSNLTYKSQATYLNIKGDCKLINVFYFYLYLWHWQLYQINIYRSISQCRMWNSEEEKFQHIPKSWKTNFQFSSKTNKSYFPQFVLDSTHPILPLQIQNQETVTLLKPQLEVCVIHFTARGVPYLSFPTLNIDVCKTQMPPFPNIWTIGLTDCGSVDFHVFMKLQIKYWLWN